MTMTHSIARLDRTGDTKLYWANDNLAEIKAAEEAFAAMQKAGMTLFRKDPQGNHTRADRFDPSADYAAVPLIIGG